MHQICAMFYLLHGSLDGPWPWHTCISLKEQIEEGISMEINADSNSMGSHDAVIPNGVVITWLIACTMQLSLLLVYTF